MPTKSTGVGGVIAIAIYLFLNIHASDTHQENSAPIVKIVKPCDKSEFYWNSLVPFSINVSDQEDGESVYDEINRNEVLLEVTYLSSNRQIDKYDAERSNERRSALRSMSKSNCLTCHASSTKLIGPSFDLIASRYAGDEESVGILLDKITKGSKGVWGEVPMPPHPDLQIAMVREMVKWILDFNSFTDYNFYVGTEGSFKTKEKPTEEDGLYFLTASYLDHGNRDLPGTGKEGLDIVTLLNKE